MLQQMLDSADYCDVCIIDQQLNKDLFVKYRNIYTEGERYYSNLNSERPYKR